MNTKWKLMLLAGPVSTICFLAASTAQPADRSPQGNEQSDRTILAQEAWSKRMADIYPPGTGCFQVSYPSTTWEQVPCKTKSAKKPARSVSRAPLRTERGASKLTGDGDDWTLAAPGLISQAYGQFPSVTGVTSVYSAYSPTVRTPGYSLQLNAWGNTQDPPACRGRPGCDMVQQFAYVGADDGEGDSGGSVVVQYWLTRYGRDCPAGWSPFNGDCYTETGYTAAPYIPVTDLANMTLKGFAGRRGYDGVMLLYQGQMYASVGDATTLDISKVWTLTEFNVFGIDDGATAVFNVGSALTAKITAQYHLDYQAPPECGRTGITGETNNLQLGPCTAVGHGPSIGDFPYIQFTESLTRPSPVINRPQKGGR